MAYWTRGRTFGTSMCNECYYEIPYGAYATKPDPDVCPQCGQTMENGYKNMMAKFAKLIDAHMDAINEEVFPKKYSVSPKVQKEICQKVFNKYLDDNIK
jgi:hypothetical protein